MAAVHSISTTASLHVAQLWRYPVKSLLGERMLTLRLIEDGVEGGPHVGHTGSQPKANRLIQLCTTRQIRSLNDAERERPLSAPVLDTTNGRSGLLCQAWHSN